MQKCREKASYAQRSTTLSKMYLVVYHRTLTHSKSPYEWEWERHIWYLKKSPIISLNQIWSFFFPCWRQSTDPVSVTFIVTATRYTTHYPAVALVGSHHHQSIHPRITSIVGVSW